MPCKPQDVRQRLCDSQCKSASARTIERYTRRGRTQLKPTGISQENVAVGFGLHRVVYVVVDTSGAQACHVRVVCINVNVNVNAKARHDITTQRALAR